MLCVDELQTKVCRKCGIACPITDYLKSIYCVDGYTNVCLACRREQKVAYALANADKQKEYLRNYKLARPGAIRERGIARRYGEKQATPLWADKQAIDEIYSQARRLQEQDGIQRHVDHIVPLMGKLVCGLHVENNLQILTALENMRKHNKFVIQ